MAIAASLLSLAGAAWSAGLGRITIQSALGQPLAAEVEITALNREEAASLNARLASPEAFKLAGLDYNPALANLRFAIDRRPDGRAVIRVSSTQPVNEPFIDMLVELTWASGRFVREYTFLLDPPELRANRQSVEGGAVQVNVGVAGAAATPTPAAAAPAPAPVAAAPAPAAQSAEPTEPSARAARPAAPAPGPANRAAAGAPAPAPASAAAEAAGGDKIQVKRGDTLGSIAGRVRPAAASIEQTLAALYEANPQAFAGRVNRLKADSTLTVPPSADIVGYDAAKARELLLAQSADFSSYRSRVAAAAPEVGGEKAGQSGAGKVGAKVEDRSAATSQDQLRISKSGTPAAKAGAAGGVGQANAEQAAAREAALKESQARVVELEKNVADLQKLIDLRSRQLAELQKQADSARPPADKPPADAAKAATPPAEATKPAPDAAAKAEEAAPPPAPASAPAPVAAKAPPPPPPPREEPSLVDELLDNPFALPALGGVLALGAGYGWFAMRRRRQAAQAEENLIGGEALSPNSLFGSTGGQSVDTSTAFGTAGPDTGVDVQATEVDPIAEAEVYIAYGREAQAEEILREALRKQPRRQAIRAKLLEIYAGRKDVASFGELAAEMHEMTGGQNEEWPKVAAMGLALDPENPLYSGQAGAPAEGEPAEGLFAQESLDERLDASPTLSAPPPEPEPEPEPALDFDLELEDTKINPPTDLQKAVDGKFDLPDLDLEPPTVVAPAEPPALDLDLGPLEGDEPRPDAEVAVQEPEDEVLWQEMGTKLDLASAYEEIGDKEGARELLDEVLKAGDADQKRRAREMLDRLS